MSKVTLKSGISFDADNNESLLDAAQRCGIILEYSCRTGRCGICKTKLQSGRTVRLRNEEYLTADEEHDGYILTCCRAAISDLVIEASELGQLAGLEIKTLPCRIDSIENVAPGVVKAVLRLPPNGGLKYFAGQYIDVIGAGGLRRSYSVANAPVDDGRLELHIRKVVNGIMSQYWFNTAKVNDLLRLEGPLGTFFLRDTVPANIVFLATGTGIAPVKAMLEEMARSAGAFADKYVSVYWGGRRVEDIYWLPKIEELLVRFIPVLSRADDSWEGRRGYTQYALLSDIVDLSDVVVYACGSDAMIQEAQKILIKNGLPEERFHSDTFVSSN